MSEELGYKFTEELKKERERIDHQKRKIEAKSKSQNELVDERLKEEKRLIYERIKHREDSTSIDDLFKKYNI